MNPANNIPSEQQLAQVSSPILATAQSLVIDSPTMYEVAADELKTIKGRYKQLEEQRKAITQPMDVAKKQVMELFKKPLEQLEQAEKILKASMLDYQQATARAAAKAQRKLDEAAAAERARMAEAAKTAEQTGDVGAAIAMQAAAEMVVAPTIQTTPAKVAGISTTIRWSAEVVSKADFLRHALANPELLDAVEISQPFLNKLAVAMKDKLNLPGIKAVATESISART